MNFPGFVIYEGMKINKSFLKYIPSIIRKAFALQTLNDIVKEKLVYEYNCFQKTCWFVKTYIFRYVRFEVKD